MTARRAILRARRRRALWLVVFSAVFLIGSAFAPTLAAQVQPLPGDTIPGDTVLVPIPPEEVVGDTVPTALREQAVSAAVLPEMPPLLPVGRTGWAEARWEWGRTELERLPGLTLLEFIELLPGFATFRAGGFGRPVGLTAPGMGGAAVRVFIDGFEMDPLSAGFFEVETIALTDLDAVRVERSTSEIRIYIRTFRLQDPEPASFVELGTGVYQTRVLRGLFSRGFGDHSVATAAFDLATTGGIGVREQYRHSNGVFRWSTTPAEGTGLQLEWRRTGLDRAGALFPREMTRTDLIGRARREFSPSITAEAVLGRSVEEEAAGEAVRVLRSQQAGLRGVYSAAERGAEGSVRIRLLGEGVGSVPVLQGEGRATWNPIAPLHLELRSGYEAGGGMAAVASHGLASFSPVARLSIFGAVELGSRLAPHVAAPDAAGGAEELAIVTSLIRAGAAGWRAGAEVAGGTATLGLAAFQSAASPLLPFGLPFDRGAAPVDAAAATGLEASFQVGLPRFTENVRLQGWYSVSMDQDLLPYTFRDIGRAALTFHGIFYEGQLEPILRVEGVRRGRAGLFPTTLQTATEAAATHRLNLSLQVRVLDVQAFLFWDNLLADQTAVDLPGVPPAFPRIVYGANWRFRN
jgi:hypothetical protein